MSAAQRARRPDARCAAAAPPLCGLRQRLLTFLFLEAQALAHGAAAGDAAARALPVQLFFRHVASYHALVLWRAHLLSATQLLLQFSFPDAAVRGQHAAAPRCGAARLMRTRAQAPDAAHAPAFVALYDFVAARFVAFFNCASEEFMAALARVPHQFSPLASDTLWARCGYDHALEAFRRHQARASRSANVVHTLCSRASARSCCLEAAPRVPRGASHLACAPCSRRTASA